jgi:hypothetical protein
VDISMVPMLNNIRYRGRPSPPCSLAAPTAAKGSRHGPARRPMGAWIPAPRPMRLRPHLRRRVNLTICREKSEVEVLLHIPSLYH